MLYSFHQSERLKGEKSIEALFQKGKRWHGKFIILYYLSCKQSENQLHQVLFAVPKRKRRKATDRNLLKRRLREGYRQKKHLLSLSKGSFLRLGYVYKGQTCHLPSYKTLAKEVNASISFLERLSSYS